MYEIRFLCCFLWLFAASSKPSPVQISAVLYIPLLKGRIFSAEEPSWNKKSLDVGLAEVRAQLHQCSTTLAATIC